MTTFALVRIGCMMILMDTLNFNIYFNKTLPTLREYNLMDIEEERMKIEMEGHPDDKYIKK